MFIVPHSCLSSSSPHFTHLTTCPSWSFIIHPPHLGQVDEAKFFKYKEYLKLMLDKYLLKWLSPLIIIAICSMTLYFIFGDLSMVIVFLVSLSSIIYGILFVDYLPINTKNENMELILRVSFPLTLMSVSYILSTFILTNSIESIVAIFPYITLSFAISLALTFVVNKLLQF